MGGTVVVDNLFIINGCCLVVLLLRELEENTELSISFIYIRRFLRFGIKLSLIPLGTLMKYLAIWVSQWIIFSIATDV
jgi:peptidoglycan/LPS O-acetylase OafA/YrhL